ncbi:RluA family pseudouridine synthase [archaeon]|nr:MAG: RluA family pseudouridine synthase [archaeon]
MTLAAVSVIAIVICISSCCSFRGIKFGKRWLSINAQIEHFVENADGKTRLDVFLSNTYTDHSRSFFASLCDKDSVIVNAKAQPKSFKVSKGDKIVFNVEEKAITNVEPEHIPLDIIYEDEHMIAINKPNGMVVHPAVGSPNGTFVNALLYHIGEKAASTLKSVSPIFNATSNLSPISIPPTDADVDLYSSNTDYDSEDESLLDIPEDAGATEATPLALRPGIVHRLDKGTTGVLMAAKHPTMVDKLSQLFASRKIVKTYLALCVGHPGDATIAESIGRGSKNRQVMCVYDGPPGKPAVTHTRTLCFDGQLSVVLVRIETGRTHQIRVHLKHKHTPLLGDAVYGSGVWNKRYVKHGVSRPMLHAYQTAFTHPITGVYTTLQAPLPADLRSLVYKISEGNMVGKVDILDPTSGLLCVSTEVRGRYGAISGDDDGHGDSGSIGGIRGGTPIILSSKGYVPAERILIPEEDWASIDLPEDPEFFR